MADTTEPLLDLTTLITRPVIAIDGAKFEILHPDQMSVIEQARMARAAREIDTLTEARPEDPDAQADSDLRLDDLIAETARRIAPDVPSEVWEKLSGAQHWAIIELFFALSLQRKMAAAGAMVRATGDLDALIRPTGAKSSPALSAGLAARPGTGWRSALRALSGRTSG